jgi:hypothetical protein
MRNCNDRECAPARPRKNFPRMIGDNREYSVILEDDYNRRHFVPHGPTEGESVARSGIEESL